MKALIIEDEIPAAEKLKRYLQKYSTEITVLDTFRSVKDSVNYLKNEPQEAEIIFMDIQLTDGLSFEIFSEVEVRVPVIFITAYDEYAIDAFQVNGIAYLLKPVTFVALSGAMKKYNQLKDRFSNTKQTQKIQETLGEISKKGRKDRFMVKIGDHIHSIKTGEISLFYADGRTVYLVTDQGKKYIVEYKLEDLEQLLSSASFFRTNRTYIVRLEAINDVIVYSNSRLKIITKIETDKDIIVSRDRVSNFKDWFEGSY